MIQLNDRWVFFDSLFLTVKSRDYSTYPETAACKYTVCACMHVRVRVFDKSHIMHSLTFSLLELVAVIWTGGQMHVWLFI